MLAHVCLLLFVCIDVVSGHTNSVGTLVEYSGTGATVHVLFGTYHTSARVEGALAIYAYGGTGDVNDGVSYTQLVAGQGGSVVSATMPMTSRYDVGTTINWGNAGYTAGEWTPAHFTAAGWTIGTDMILDGPVNNFVMASTPTELPLNIGKLLFTYDPAPVGATPSAALSADYKPCGVGTIYSNCKSFRMVNLFVTIGSTPGSTIISGVSVSNLPPAAPAPTGATAINCPCVTSYPAGVTLVGGQPQATISGSVYSYPASYGLNACDSWDATLQPSCATLDGTGNFDPLANPDWCSTTWCYVDPANCNVGALDRAPGLPSKAAITDLALPRHHRTRHPWCAGRARQLTFGR